jgi:hypothetical protein
MRVALELVAPGEYLCGLITLLPILIPCSHSSSELSSLDSLLDHQREGKISVVTLGLGVLGDSKRVE